MMLTAEGMHLRTGDPVWRALPRRWPKLFAVGAASGTIITVELGLLFGAAGVVFSVVAGRAAGISLSPLHRGRPERTRSSAPSCPVEAAGSHS
jgi:cytochrome d ubiquinol oxidase subunit I